MFEKTSHVGGVWRRVHAGARINTPSFGYTFHASNRWQSPKPSRAEILENLEQLVRISKLERAIQFETPVHRISKTESGKWTVNDESPEYDGVLVCPGFLGRRMTPPPALTSRFKGRVMLAYQAEPEALRGRNVVIVGSGASALDMLSFANNSQCRRATLFIRPGVKIRDVGRFESLKHAIVSNPLIYRLTKRPGGKPAAVCTGINSALNSSRVHIVREEIQRVSEHHVLLAQGGAIEADCIIWCTGWESPTPSWVKPYRQDPSLVLAACRHCLDTSGFGFGAATVHAKALLAALEHDLLTPFHSDTSRCDCEQENPDFSRHILLGLARYYLSQPGGWRLLAKGLKEGFQSNLERMRTMEESRWASLLAFVNAPFGF